MLASSLYQLRANHVEPLIEFKLDQQEIDLTDVLNGLTWIREWSQDGEIYKVLTDDMEKAKALLPHILLESFLKVVKN